MKLFMRNARNGEIQLKLNHRQQPMMMMMMMMMMLLLMLMTMLWVGHASVEATNATCKHATNMWGDPNPNIFYVCSVGEQTPSPLQLRCPEGRGFFNGLGHLGCLPYDQWPACRPSVPLTASCNSSEPHAKDQPWATLDPNQFYMCPGVNAAPLRLNCAPGKGFVQTAKTVGCADWSYWRRVMQCEAYY